MDFSNSYTKPAKPWLVFWDFPSREGPTNTSHYSFLYSAYEDDPTSGQSFMRNLLGN